MRDYLCKKCSNNNNGWCTLHKKQGLKSITTCNDHKLPTDDYLCKRCIHNNNGWCSKHKKQNLKKVRYCSDRALYKPKVVKIKYNSDTYNSNITKPKYLRDDLIIAESVGQAIQMQALLRVIKNVNSKSVPDKEKYDIIVFKIMEMSEVLSDQIKADKIGLKTEEEADRLLLNSFHRFLRDVQKLVGDPPEQP